MPVFPDVGSISTVSASGKFGCTAASAARALLADASLLKPDGSPTDRETRLYQVAPISTNLILSYVAEHVLGLPRSF